MSQFPPPQPPPPPQFPPQPGFGPPMPYPPQKQTNGLAIGSLVFGILGCVPVVTSLLAVILGFAGLRKARDPRYGGKGVAIAGLLLGLLGLVGWASAGGAAYWG